jgi:hypothetical protein
VEADGSSFVIKKGGIPCAVLLRLSDYVCLATAEPEVLRLIGRESKPKHTDTLNSGQIDRIIKAARRRKTNNP